MKLSPAEKLILFMLADIHKHLKIQGEIDPEFITNAIVGGHNWALEWNYTGLFDAEENAPAIVKEVVDILDMWDMLETAYERMSAAEHARIEKEAGPLGKGVQFPGFDGNNESEHMSISSFFVVDMGRWKRFVGRGLNSHHPTVDGYRRMLSAFLPIRSGLGDSFAAGGSGLTVDQLIQVLKARRHP